MRSQASQNKEVFKHKSHVNTYYPQDCVVRISLVFVSMMYVLNHIGMMEQIKIAEIIRFHFLRKLFSTLFSNFEGL